MLNDLISRSTLGDLAGTPVLQLGDKYFAAGAVTHLRAVKDRITAEVGGTKTYRVELRNDEGELAYDCTCPRAAHGYFCKHCVAAGLAWLAENPAVPTSRAASGKKKRHDPWSDIKEYLNGLMPDALVGLLLEVAQRDDRLYQSMLLKADRSAGGGNLSETLRQAIDRATQIDDFVDWREIATFAAKLDQIIDSLAELLKPATAAMLIELAEYAIERAENALEQIDDSSGEMGDIILRLGELHLSACIMAQPDPEELAERLFRFETTLPFGVCSFDAVAYRDAIGKDGLSRYRELAQAEWRKFKPRDAKADYDARRTAITRIMERLAEASGDVNELVAIKSMDLSSSFYYLNIANIWAKAGQPDKAMDWAERGMKAFPERPDNRSLLNEDLARMRYEASIRPGFQEAFARMFPAPRQRGVDGLASPEAAIRELPHQTMIVHGREDKVIPLASSYKLFDLIPRAQLHVFGECGHWTQIEHGARFNRMVGDLFAEEPS
jgi:tetratricopeptide (TPR) repeat protein